MRWTGQIFWLLAFARFEKHASFSPPSPSRSRGTIGLGKSYPVTAAQLLPNLTGIPRTGPLIKLHKELPPEVAGRIRTLKIYFGRNGEKLQGEAIFNRLLLRSAVANRRSLKHKVLALVGSGFIYQMRTSRSPLCLPL
jgi:hypothetical protein